MKKWYFLLIFLFVPVLFFYPLFNLKTDHIFIEINYIETNRIKPSTIEIILTKNNIQLASFIKNKCIEKTFCKKYITEDIRNPSSKMEINERKISKSIQLYKFMESNNNLKLATGKIKNKNEYFSVRLAEVYPHHYIKYAKRDFINEFFVIPFSFNDSKVHLYDLLTKEFFLANKVIVTIENKADKINFEISTRVQ